PQVPGHCQPGADVAQQCGPEYQVDPIGHRHADQTEVTVVEPRQAHHRRVQPGQAEGQHQPGQQAGAQAIQRAQVEEGTAHVAVGSAHQFDDLDLLAAVLDMQADGVADYQQQGQHQQ